MTVSAERRFRLHKRTVAALIVLLLILGALAEMGTRAVMSHKLATTASHRFATSVEVGVGSTPALLDLATGSVPQVTLRSDNATICSLSGVSLDASLHDVALRGSGSGHHVDSSTATITLGDAAITDLIAAKSSTLAQNASVSFSPADDTAQLKVGPGGLVQISMRPKLADDKVTMSAVSASVAGRSVPTSRLSSLMGGTSSGTSLSDLPMGLHATGLKITDAGIQLNLEGGATTLQPDKNNSAACSANA